MRLLVTNDDGIDSVFLHELVFALKAAGHELAVAAPRHEQSWIGAAKSRNRHVATARSAAYAAQFGCDVWVIDGTPSDCVNIALAHLIGAGSAARGMGREAWGTGHGATGAEQPAHEQATPAPHAPRPTPTPLPHAPSPMPVDGVVSGINVGLNASLGFVLASGTIAGAWEGALHGLPAVAISQDLTFEEYDRLKYGGRLVQDTSPTKAAEPDRELRAMLKNSAAIAARMAGELIRATPANAFTVHNLNFPFGCRPDSKVVRTVPAQVVVPGLFGPAEDDGTHRFVFKLGEDVSPEKPMTDRAALAAGMISHTVLDYRKLGG